jgi:hypothetical protein
MTLKTAKRLFVLFVSILFIMACGLPLTQAAENAVSEEQAAGAAQTAVPTNEAPTVVVTSPQLTIGNCANPYYPVREGSTWNYKSTGSPAGEYSFTDTIIPVRSDGFTLKSQFGELTRTQDWACRPEGLVALQLGGGALQAQNLSVEVKTQNASGVMYPAVVKIGDQWDYLLEFTGTMDIAGNTGDANGTVQNHFTAPGMESVTVPVGTFTALKIQIDTTMTISVTYQGITVPIAFSGSYTYWFVQDLGWVKAVGSGDMGGQPFTEVIELQWYNLP